MNEQDQLNKYNDLLDRLRTYSEPVKKKVKRRAVNLSNVTIRPVGNGYALTSTDTGGRLFVFETLDAVKEFLDKALAPTEEQADFLEEV